MASKLRVENLRAELAKRGLDTTGTKPFLVQRLKEALLNENKEEEEEEEENKENDANIGFQNDKKKRGREVDVQVNEDSTNKIKAIEEFRQMNVKQLREQATVRGLSVVGTKKELLQRLCDDSDKNSLGEEEEEKVSSKEEKIITATKKGEGAAVLDQGIPDHIKAHYHVLQQASLCY